MSRKKCHKNKPIKKQQRGCDNYHGAVISDRHVTDAAYGLPRRSQHHHGNGDGPNVVSVLKSLVRVLTNTVGLCVLVATTRDELQSLHRSLSRRRTVATKPILLPVPDEGAGWPSSTHRYAGAGRLTDVDSP